MPEYLIAFAVASAITQIFYSYSTLGKIDRLKAETDKLRKTIVRLEGERKELLESNKPQDGLYK